MKPDSRSRRLEGVPLLQEGVGDRLLWISRPLLAWLQSPVFDQLVLPVQTRLGDPALHDDGELVMRQVVVDDHPRAWRSTLPASSARESALTSVYWAGLVCGIRSLDRSRGRHAPAAPKARSAAMSSWVVSAVASSSVGPFGLGVRQEAYEPLPVIAGERVAGRVTHGPPFRLSRCSSRARHQLAQESGDPWLATILG